MKCADHCLQPLECPGHRAGGHRVGVLSKTEGHFSGLSPSTASAHLVGRPRLPGIPEPRYVCFSLFLCVWAAPVHLPTLSVQCTEHRLPVDKPRHLTTVLLCRPAVSGVKREKEEVRDGGWGTQRETNFHNQGGIKSRRTALQMAFYSKPTCMVLQRSIAGDTNRVLYP